MAELIVVEDDPLVRDLVAHVLGRAGHRVRLAVDGAALRATFAARAADLVVLDLTLPDADGLDLARWLRSDGGGPGIVVLTALGEAIDRVAGLEAGADDYLAKPFEPEELVARVEAVLRRRRPAGAPAPRLGPWRLHVDAGRLLHDDGRELRVGRGTLELLAAFARHPGRILSREELMDLAPGREGEPFDRSIDQRIARLRQKLEPDPRHPVLIQSVRGRGYRYPG